MIVIKTKISENSFHVHKVKFAPQGWASHDRQNIQKQKQT